MSSIPSLPPAAHDAGNNKTAQNPTIQCGAFFNHKVNLIDFAALHDHKENFIYVIKKISECVRKTINRFLPENWHTSEVKRDTAKPGFPLIPIRFGDNAARAAMYGAEHLSVHSSFAGLAIEKTNFLAHIEKSKLPEISMLSSIFKPYHPTTNINKTLNQLVVGQKVAFQLGRRAGSTGSHHAISVIFQKKADDKIDITVVNTGYGIEEFHPKVPPRSKEDCSKYKLAIEYHEVSIKALQESELFRETQSDQTIEDFYSALSKIPHKKSTSHTTNARYPQLGGNCSIASQMETLRYLLCDCAQSPEEAAEGKQAYKKFKQEVRFREYSDLTDKIQQSSFPGLVQDETLVAHEIAMKLNKPGIAVEIPKIGKIKAAQIEPDTTTSNSALLNAIATNDPSQVQKAAQQLKTSLSSLRRWSDWEKELLSLVAILYDQKEQSLKLQELTNLDILQSIYQEIFKDTTSSAAFQFLPKQSQGTIDQFRSHILLILKKTKKI